jgi:uncharacterized repeat protein (TIGR03803 family)
MQPSRKFNLASLLLATAFSFLALGQKAQGQTFTDLYNFPSGYSQAAGPTGGIIEDSAGNLYGTNNWAGPGYPSFVGSVFKLDPAGTVTTLHFFSNGVDGASPTTGLLIDSDGNLYGTTSAAGDQTCSCGTVFKIDTDNVFKTLHTFTGTDGKSPSLWFSFNGVLYGTAAGGGSGSSGVIFKITKNGKYTALHELDGPTEGNGPGQLVRDAAGNLYGVAVSGGSSANAGTIFELDTTGKFTVLYSFTGGLDGASPVGLIRNTQGVIHGVANGGGDPAFQAGTVFNLGTTGKLTVLHTFHRSQRPGGLFPSAIFDLNGTLYGSTDHGGDLCAGTSEPVGCGVLFKIAGNGQYSVIHRFEGSDGIDPSGRLTRLRDGNLYGSASGDGLCGGICGTIFKVTP